MPIKANYWTLPVVDARQTVRIKVPVSTVSG
jgi:hypothetical protein